MKPAPAGGEARSVAAFLVSRLQIARGRFLFVDRKVSPRETITIALDDLTGEVSDVGPTSAARFDLAARFLADAGRNLTLKGTLGPPDPEKGLGQAPLSATFGAKSLALSWLQPYFGASANFDPGVFSIDGTAEGAILGVLKLAGNVSLVPPAAPSAVPSIEGKFAMQLDWPAGSLVVAKSPLAVAKLPLTAEGRIDGLHATPRLDLRIATPGEVPLDAVTGLPGLAGSLPADVKLSGRVRLEASIEGSSSDLTTRGAVDAAPFSVSRGGEPLLVAPAIRATLASRGKEPLTGRITAPSGNLQKLPFENLAADWSWDKGALTLASDAPRLRRHVERPRGGRSLAPEVGVARQPGRPGRSGPTASRVAHLDAQRPGRRSDGEDVGDEPRPHVGRLLEDRAGRGEAVARQRRAQDGRAHAPGREHARRGRSGRRVRGAFQPPIHPIHDARDGASPRGWPPFHARALALGPRRRRRRGRLDRPRSIARLRGPRHAGLRDRQEPRQCRPIRRRRAGPPLVAFPRVRPDLRSEVAIDDSVVLDLGRRVLARQARDRIQGGAGKILGDVLEGGDGKKTDPLDILQQFLKAPPSPLPRRRRIEPAAPLHR